MQQNLKLSLLKQQNPDELDDQALADFEEDYEEVNDVMQITKDVAEIVLKKSSLLQERYIHNKRVASNVGKFYMEVFTRQGKYKSVKEKVYAVVFMDYVLEAC